MIHRVPDRLLANKRDDYEPKVVSLGPYHFGEEKLMKFQKLKGSMAARVVSDDEELEASLRFEIRKNIDSLRNAYSSEKMETLEHIDWDWEKDMFLDGCFVLYFIFCIICDQVEDLNIQRYDIDSVHNDLFLAENQLPFQLLKILSGNDSELLVLIDDYIYSHKISNDIEYWAWRQRDEPVHLLDRLRTIIIGNRSETQKWQHAIWGQWQSQIAPPSEISNNVDWDWRQDEPPNHLLDSLRTIIIGGRSKTQKWQHAIFWGMWRSTPQHGTKSIVLRKAKELTARGIHLKPNRTGLLKDIYFRSHFIYGTLRLPRIIVDDSTKVLFLNLAAYEMCTDVGSTITSYICFLDSLVNHADDIKELQSAGILVNHLATEEAAATLFNEMSQGLHPAEDTYIDVKKKIQKFSGDKTKASIASWIAEGYHNHFKSPLTAMAVFAAFVALCLAATQTYFTVYPRGNR